MPALPATSVLLTAEEKVRQRREFKIFRWVWGVGGVDKRKSKREERKLEGVSYSLTDKFGDGLVVRASASVEAVGVDGTRTSDQRPQRRC